MDNTQRQELANFIADTAPVGSAMALEIAMHFEERELFRGDHFLKAGKVSNEYLFLTSGFLRAFAFDVDGDEVTTGFYKNQQVVFEVSSFFTRTPSKESIHAITDCDGLVINYETLNNLFHGLPEFREFGRAVLVKGYTSLKARMLSAITATAEERYKELMQANPEILQYASLKAVASYLGITDTSLSRIRKELSQK